MLLDNAMVTMVADVVDDDCWPAHGGLHQAIVAMHITGQQAATEVAA